MQRFYRLDIQPDLFGNQCLIRKYGRIGRSGQMRITSYQTENEAQIAFHKQRKIKERRGYSLEDIGERYYTHRQSIMLANQEGLTKTYNRFHDSYEHSAEIVKLRELHTQMDEAVAHAYGWDDLVLGHGFHETKQGLRYTICEAARREVLDRLLLLNHERHEEEVEAGLFEAKGAKGKGAKKSTRKTTNGVAGKNGKVVSDGGVEQGALF
jgi:predicted DNA-binding WGR domain protein